MRQFIRPCVISLALSGVLLLTGCGTSGATYDSVNYSVYSGYDYPYYGYGGYYYDDDDDDHHHRHDGDRHDRPDRPGNRPGTRPGGGMGRPSGGMMRGGGGRGGGGRRR